MLKTHDQQELLNIVYNGVVAQGGPSIENDNCLYESPNGRRCGAALCLNDDAFTFATRFERVAPNGTSIDKVVEEYSHANPESEHINGAMLGFLDDIQSTHDELQYWNSEDWIKQWDRGINLLAKRYELDSPVK